MRSIYPLAPAKQNDPQALAGCLTYARRYSILCLCGVAPEDDDGQTASAPQPSNRPITATRPARMVKVADKLPQEAPLKDYKAYVDIIKLLAGEYDVSSIQIADACELPEYKGWTVADFPRIIAYFDRLAADRNIEAATHKPRKGKK